jgi:hypothetical protein
MPILCGAGGSLDGMSDYTLDERGSIPAEAKDFYSCLCDQTSTYAHPASCRMGTGG